MERRKQHSQPAAPRTTLTSLRPISRASPGGQLRPCPECPFAAALAATGTVRHDVPNGGYASSQDCRVNCGLRSADRRGRRSRSRGALTAARDWRRPLPASKLADGCAQFAQACRAPRQRHRRCVRPRIPGFSPGGLGPHLTSSGSPCGLSSGFPFARRGLPLRPPSSGFPSSGVLRFVPFGRCPGSGSLRCPSRFPSLEQSPR
jgi:hypothetical protein